MNENDSELILVVAPVGRDAELICSNLRSAGIQAAICEDVPRACARVADGAGALLMTEEALRAEALTALQRCLASQPPWSDVPVIVLVDALSQERARAFDLGTRTDVTYIDRPVRIKSLVSAASSALRARRRQYQIRDLMLELQERINERDRFLAVLGHELRNPLGAILLAAQMTDEEGRIDSEHARLIERQSRHLTQLVNDLLDLSRVAAGKIVLKREIVDVREITDQALRMVEAAARQHRLTVRLESPPEPLLIDADAVRIEQIVSNVLTNAVKYTPDGGHVSIALARDGGSALIRVKDDGVGIAAERIGAIFELFAQAENAIGRAQGGMGIGLALVRNLVQLHGGTIEAHSDGVGRGSEFVIRLPLAPVVEAPARRPLEAAAKRAAKAAPSVPRRIVIVEDNSDVRDLLRLRLRRLGHHVEAAGDGHEGLRVLLTEKPDLALVDLGLPGIDGFAVAREVRQQLGDGIVLVAVSGFGQPEDKRRALAAGFDEHITKPADIQDIEGVLHRFPPRNTADSEPV